VAQQAKQGDGNLCRRRVAESGPGVRQQSDDAGKPAQLRDLRRLGKHRQHASQRVRHCRPLMGHEEPEGFGACLAQLATSVPVARAGDGGLDDALRVCLEQVRVPLRHHAIQPYSARPAWKCKLRIRGV